MYIPSGMKASELILLLTRMIAKHGDCEVFSGGSDYPEGVEDVSFNKEERAYYPANCFIL